MKKLLIFLLVVLLLLCFSACDEANVNGETNNTTDRQESAAGTTPETNGTTNSTAGAYEGSTDETGDTKTESDSETHPSVSTPTLELFVPIPTLEPFVPPTIDPVECQHIFLNQNITIIKPATCEEAGEFIGTCIYCKKEIISTPPALGHETVIDMAISPTCTQDGKSEGSHCSRCNEVFIEQETIPALGGEHVIVIDEAVEATCTQTGLSEGKHCSRCGKIYVRQAVIPEKAHAIGDWIVDKEATCTENGKQHLECENCDYREEKITSVSHQYNVTEEKGKKTFSCNTCDRMIENVEDIIILFQKNDDETYTVEVSGGYGKISCHWNTYRPELVYDPGLGMERGTYEDVTQFSFHIDLSSGVGGIIYSYTHIKITATDELGQQSVYKFKLSTSELISSEHTIVDTNS